MWNERMNGWKASKEAKARNKALSFILALALVFGSLGVTGWGIDTVYATESDYVTVRIEGNGFGTNGTESGIDTVIENTKVYLYTLTEDTAIYAVNKALEINGLPTAEGSSGYYTTFGGVSGTGDTGWSIIVNDASASEGLDTLTISPDDDIVLMLTGNSGAPNYYATTDYAYFKTVSSSSAIQWGYAYGEVTLALYSKEQQGWTDSEWVVTPVADTPIYSGGLPAYTPDSSLAVTDAENGVATITLWGGGAAGTYYFDITATVGGATSAYCRAKMVYDGTTPPTLTFSAPSANDTTLDSLTLTFPGTGAAPSNGLAFVGTDGIKAGNPVQSVVLTAAAVHGSATVTATYKDADDSSASAYTLGQSVDLVVGDNIFKLTVRNGSDVQIHTLIVTRRAPEIRNIPDEVNSVINGVKTVTGDAPYSDWVLAMNAAGLSLSDPQLETYLSGLLVRVNDFIDHGTGSQATMAKHAIALTSLGIDARQIPDPDGGETIDLVKAIAATYDAETDLYPVYSAPYVLSLYDLGNYDIPVGAASSRLELIDAILDAEADWTSYGYDSVGMILPALAPYYNATAAVNGIALTKCQEITAAVDRVLDSMSSAQTIDGGFGSLNSNTISFAITGLNAIGIDSSSDSDYIKGGTSLLMNLLSYRTADDKLGFNNSTSVNTLACVQGFQALATWKNLSNARSSNLYHFTKETTTYTNWPDANLLTGIRVTAPTETIYDLDENETDYPVDTAGMVVTATYNGDASNTQVVSSGYTVTNIDLSRQGSQMVTVTYQGHTATFMITVRTSGGVILQDTVSVRVKSNSRTIASNNAVVIEAGETTVMDVLKMALDSAGIDYVIDYGAYVAEIDGLGQFELGGNSGWLYKVNGWTPPVTGAADYVLENGDTVEWYYSLDYTTDESTREWRSGQTEAGASSGVASIALTVRVDSSGKAVAAVSNKEIGAAIIAARESLEDEDEDVKIELRVDIDGTKDAKSVELTIPNSAFKQLKADVNALTIKASVAEIRLDEEVINTLAAQAKNDVKITAAVKSAAEIEGLGEEEKSQIGSRPVFDFTIIDGSNTISELGGNAVITVPYEADVAETADGLVIYYINDSGNLEIIKNCIYDPEKKLMTFTVDHFSQYALGYKALDFADTVSHWAKDHITFLAAREVINGMTDTAYAPNSNITRAQFVQILANLDGADLDNYSDKAGTFADVQSGAWYAEAAAWAAENAIVTGSADQSGNVSFRPNEAISRQDMAAILSRFAVETGYSGLSAVKEGKTFADTGEIASYAKDAVAKLQQAGLLDGKTAENFAPKGLATRAECAKIISMLMKTK